MIDVLKELDKIQELFSQTYKEIPTDSKEKFRQLKILEEIELRVDLCLYEVKQKTGLSWYDGGETIGRVGRLV